MKLDKNPCRITTEDWVTTNTTASQQHSQSQHEKRVGTQHHSYLFPLSYLYQLFRCCQFHHCRLRGEIPFTGTSYCHHIPWGSLHSIHTRGRATLASYFNCSLGDMVGKCRIGANTSNRRLLDKLRLSLRSRTENDPRRVNLGRAFLRCGQGSTWSILSLCFRELGVDCKGVVWEGLLLAGLKTFDDG